jgi:hypothetical protein
MLSEKRYYRVVRGLAPIGGWRSTPKHGWLAWHVLHAKSGERNVATFIVQAIVYAQGGLWKGTFTENAATEHLRDEAQIEQHI